jgi:hypothetical protein
MSIDLSDGWAETTHDVPDEDAPFTLARQAEDACGAFQFSIALYKGGRLPFAKGADLLKLLLDFAASHELGRPADLLAQDDPLPIAAATFSTSGDTVRVGMFPMAPVWSRRRISQPKTTITQVS